MLSHVKCTGPISCSSAIFTKGSSSITSFVLPWTTKTFQEGSTLKGKNLLLREQILFFKSLPHFGRDARKKTVPCIPKNLYPFTFMSGNNNFGSTQLRHKSGIGKYEPSDDLIRANN